MNLHAIFHSILFNIYFISCCLCHLLMTFCISDMKICKHSLKTYIYLRGKTVYFSYADGWCFFHNSLPKFNELKTRRNTCKLNVFQDISFKNKSSYLKCSEFERCLDVFTGKQGKRLIWKCCFAARTPQKRSEKQGNAVYSGCVLLCRLVMWRWEPQKQWGICHAVQMKRASNDTWWGNQTVPPAQSRFTSTLLFYIIINALRKLPTALQFGFNLDVGLRVISPANSDVTVIVCLLEFNLRSGDGLKRDYVEEN